MQVGEYVQFGSGFSAPEGWLNFDVSPTLRFERLPLIGKLYTRNVQRFPENVFYGDIVKGLPISDDSCVGIYCSHVLEHLASSDVDVALRNVFGYLQVGGVFRFVVPDLEQLARAYLASSDPMASWYFMEASGLGTKYRDRRALGFLKEWLGNSKHLWLWDAKSLAHKLEEHGFTGIRRAYFGDAEDPQFKAVEERARFEGCVAMQCRK